MSRLFKSGKGDSDSLHLMRVPGRNMALIVATAYLVFGVLWILFTDHWVDLAVADPEQRQIVESVKGIFYVLLSTGLIYLLIGVLNRRVQFQAQQLGAVFSSPEFGALRFSEGGAIETFTPCLTQLLGYTEPELKHMHLKDLVHPDDWRKEKALLERFQNKEIDRASRSLRMRKKDGRIIWVEQNVRLFEYDGSLSFVSTLQWIDDRIEAENNLREALREKDALINNTSDLIWSLDREMRIVSFNQAYADAVKILQGMVISKGHSAVMPEFGEEISERWRGYYERALSGENFTTEEENRSELGKYISEIQISPIWDEKTVVGVSCIARDITALKHSENQLAERAERLLNAQKIAKMGDWTFDFETGDITWSNMVYTIFDRNPEDGPVPFKETLGNYFSEEDAERLQYFVEQAGKTGESYDFESTLILPDGTEKRIRSLGAPYQDDQQRWKMRGVVQDVTERVSMESRLREHEEYWQLISRHASDAIVACDSERKLILFNDAARAWVGDMDSGLSPADWPRAYGLYTVEGDRRLKEGEIDLLRALNGEDVRDYRASIRKEGMPTRFIESNGGPLVDQNGKQIGAMVIVRDITERYQKEFELTNAVIEAAENERHRIAAELHDSVTQELSIVSLNLNNFRVENPEKTLCERFQRAQSHLHTAIGQIRGISHRIMPGSVRDLGLIGAVSELVEDIQRTTDLRVDLEFNKEVRLAKAMELDVFRIIQEALNNALKHAEADRIHIKIHFGKTYLDISVIDNGIGMEASRRKDGQVGIGLRTMRNRAMKYGGHLFLHSGERDTTVEASIPLEDPS